MWLGVHIMLRQRCCISTMDLKQMYGLLELFCTFYSLECLTEIQREGYLSMKFCVISFLHHYKGRSYVGILLESHQWIVDDRDAPDKPLDFAVLSRLKQFSAMNELKKMALRGVLYAISITDLSS
ncbi:unnamed protein product [Camellia sinensis]